MESQEPGTYYSRNKQKVLDKVREYQSTRKDHYRQQYKEWYAINKDEVNKKRREKHALIPKVKKERVKKEPVASVPVILPIFLEEQKSNIEYTGHDFYLTFE
jgi:hypothetical protein